MVMTKDEDNIREEIDVDAATLSFQSKERRNVYLYLRLIFPEWMSIGERIMIICRVCRAREHGPF